MPTWRDRIEKAKKLAREKAPVVQARAEEAAHRAGVVARQQSEKGREKFEEKKAERRREAEQREHWFEVESGTIHTEGFPDEESMRRSIEAAAEHGWLVVNIAQVPKRKAPGGLTTLVAREAVERVKQSAQFMVTFKREPDDRPAPDDGKGPEDGQAAARPD